MRKKTIITTETREVWVIRQQFGVFEVPDSENSESEPSSESLTLHIDHDAKRDNASSADSATLDVQE